MPRPLAVVVEQYKPGYKRRLTPQRLKAGNGVRWTLATCQRISRSDVKPELWSPWEFWGFDISKQKLIERHNEALGFSVSMKT